MLFLALPSIMAGGIQIKPGSPSSRERPGALLALRALRSLIKSCGSLCSSLTLSCDETTAAQPGIAPWGGGAAPRFQIPLSELTAAFQPNSTLKPLANRDIFMRAHPLPKSFQAPFLRHFEIIKVFHQIILKISMKSL